MDDVSQFHGEINQMGIFIFTQIHIWRKICGILHKHHLVWLCPCDPFYNYDPTLSQADCPMAVQFSFESCAAIV